MKLSVKALVFFVLSTSVVAAQQLNKKWPVLKTYEGKYIGYDESII